METGKYLVVKSIPIQTISGQEFVQELVSLEEALVELGVTKEYLEKIFPKFVSKPEEKEELDAIILRQTMQKLGIVEISLMSDLRKAFNKYQKVMEHPPFVITMDEWTYTSYAQISLQIDHGSIKGHFFNGIPVVRVPFPFQNEKFKGFVLYPEPQL